MTPANFKVVRELAYELTGIYLTDKKENMIYARLARRLRALKMRHFDEYCALLLQETSPETPEFVNAITTNLTSFFREKHHFDYLAASLLPELYKLKNASRRIRIWSAGCSTGEEPYSIAMTVSNCSAFRDWDVKILATDLDTNVVAKAKEGVYSFQKGDLIPKDYSQYFEKSKDSDFIRMKKGIRELITFKPLNLLKPWPMKGKFDLIFCRNVVIYFDEPTQRTLFDRYSKSLQAKGHLFIGHSENLNKVSDRFDTLGRTIYRLKN